MLKMPVTTRMRFVCTPTARQARCDDDPCEYSSRQWCSGAQYVSNPAASAAIPTSMSRRMRSGSVTSHGRGPTEAPWKTPNSSGMGAGYSRLDGSLTSANGHRASVHVHGNPPQRPRAGPRVLPPLRFRLGEEVLRVLGQDLQE